ncbi:hypothetical protein ASE17_06945 [Phenylobacterium sp. Root77]|uniref:hypothetical protein n=1 Tax=unclassified Phenylobacterium TaxID=2640670 RepID=UPI0007018168|nr:MULTISPECIES: hypothetical protein [unclassified Phenylobacterium]KQW68185.1 hypothetical protein ASC73_16850 [Phenylobacterium sp. Root1277]KQW91926.1 hypothetical protein ASC79_10225 [Phenylobacterium sp. Root1290]KRC40158.1 hypothetical protein ASE17_06945 [Phenylobacterium sp. Root77]
MSRILAGALAVLLGLNALAMLFGSFWWYNAVPGVIATGPYNPHFVRDIGAAYLVVAAGLAWFAWRPAQGWPALAAGATFLTLHAGIHVFDASCSSDPVANLIRDLPGVYAPALIAAAIAVFRRPV